MPPRSVKKTARTAAPKKAKTKSTKKTPLSKPEPEIVQNVEMVEQATPVEEDTKVPEVPIKEEKSIEDGKLKGLSTKDVAPAEEPAPVSEYAPKKEEEVVKAPFDEEDEKGESLELYENVSQSDPEEEENVSQSDPKEDADTAAMDLDQDGVAQKDEEEVLEDHLDEAENAGDDVDVDDESIGEEEESESESEEEELGEENELGEEEEDEQHEVVKERRKRKEFEVFVGGLHKDAAEEDLRKVFSKVGEVVEIRLMMNPQTQKNKGFAFIRYAAVDQAKRACTELKNPQVKGKVCGVSPSQDSDTLFLGNICKTWTKEAVKEKLKSFGVDNIEDFTLVEDVKNEGMNRGFAFLEFSSRSDAMNAYKRLQKRDVVLGTDKTAKVSFAETFVEPDEEVMAQVKTVFVDGLPPSWDEDGVKEQFKKYGDIDKIELGRNMLSARRADFGFVTFSTHDAAVACIDGINNIGLAGEDDNKVKVKARLLKPRQKGRLWKHGVRGSYKVGRGRGGVRTRGGKVPSVEPRRFGARGGEIGVKRRSVERPIGGYRHIIDRPYRDRRGRDYDNFSGSKRPYAALEQLHRFGVPSTRNSRSRLEYGISSSASGYGDYGESNSRLGRGSQLGYGGSARQQDSYGLYDGHQFSVGYGGSHTYSSLRGSGADGTYSSYGNDYLGSGANMGGSSYSSRYWSPSMASRYPLYF